MRRYFEKQTGKKVAWWEIELRGVRYDVAWGTLGARGRGMTCTRHSEDDAKRMMEQKIRAKVKAGYVEKPPPKGTDEGVEEAAPTPRPLSPVLDAHLVDAAKYRFEPRKLDGLEHAHHVSGGLGFEEFILVGPDPNYAVWFVVKEASYDPKHVHAFMRFLESHHERVFAVEVAWKTKLDEPIGPFGHALVVAPVAAQIYTKGLTMTQQFRALPIYDCEFRGDESITEADARTNGRGCIPHSRWDRAPHPVFDVRLQEPKKRKKKHFLIFPPEKAPRLVARLSKLRENSTMDVRNFRGDVARVTYRDGGLRLQPDIESDEAATLAADDVVERLQRFITSGER